MKAERIIDVAALDLPHRRALEEVIGHELETHQQLVISVNEVAAITDEDRPIQTLDDWAGVYKGLTDAEIDEIDTAVRTRIDLSRDVL